MSDESKLLDVKAYKSALTLVTCLKGDALEGWQSGKEDVRAGILGGVEEMALRCGCLRFEVYLEEPDEGVKPLIRKEIAGDNEVMCRVSFTQSALKHLLDLLNEVPDGPWIGGETETGRVDLYWPGGTLDLDHDPESAKVVQFAAHARNFLPTVLGAQVEAIQLCNNFLGMLAETKQSVAAGVDPSEMVPIDKLEQLIDNSAMMFNHILESLSPKTDFPEDEEVGH